MRILFLSNFYPPASRGGYEQWCQEVLDGLRSRGHAVKVLTSNFASDRLPEPDPAWVERSLHLEMEFASLKNAIQFFTHRKKREAQNLRLVRATVQAFKPEVVLIWGMWNLPRSIPALAEELLPGRVVYYMGDYWPTLPDQFENYWKAAPRNPITGLPKLALKPFALQILAGETRPQLKFEHVLFPSMFMRDEFNRLGASPVHAQIVHGAVDTSRYQPRRAEPVGSTLRLLCIAARLEHEKGVHTAIEAVGQLVRTAGFTDLKLTIVGGHGKPEYEAHLKNMVAGQNLEAYIEFLPPVPKDELPALYQQADIFVFTSIWAEPFGRVLVEALASGVAVIGTRVGGAGEILVENENALVFPADDPASLAQQVQRLAASPELRRRLAQAGRESAIGLFDIQRMTRDIETYLGTLGHS